MYTFSYQETIFKQLLLFDTSDIRYLANLVYLKNMQTNYSHSVGAMISYSDDRSCFAYNAIDSVAFYD